MKLIRYGDDSHKQIHVNVEQYIILYTQYACYMFRPHLWPSSGRCITRLYYKNVL